MVSNVAVLKDLCIIVRLSIQFVNCYNIKLDLRSPRSDHVTSSITLL